MPCVSAPTGFKACSPKPGPSSAGTSASLRRKAEDMLSDRHFREFDELGSGRSELFPSEVRELHAQEWDEFEKFAPIRPDGRANLFLVKDI
jgi:hypothetical protein